MYSILGLPIFLSVFNIGNEQTQIVAVSDPGNTTSTARTTEISISDINGTNLLTSYVIGPICWETPEGGKGCEPAPGIGNYELLFTAPLNINITMKASNGTEIISFENIQVKCAPSAGNTDPVAHCVQN
jgi:hypothetical protein